MPDNRQLPWILKRLGFFSSAIYVQYARNVLSQNVRPCYNDEWKPKTRSRIRGWKTCSAGFALMIGLGLLAMSGSWRLSATLEYQGLSARLVANVTVYETRFESKRYSAIAPLNQPEPCSVACSFWR